MNEQARSTWWTRNWKWALPLGCAGLSAMGIMAVLLAVAVVMGAMRSTWAYRHGVELARSNPEVVAALGEPIETGWFFRGSVNVSGPSGSAELAIPIHGPSDRATLFVVAAKYAGQWSFELAEVQVRDRETRIDLLWGSEGEVTESPLKLMAERR